MAMTLAKLRSGLQTALRGADRSNIIKRSLSSSAGHDDEHETAKWEKITYAGIVSCSLLAFYNLSKGHPHYDEPPAYPYLHIRNKEFPWGCGFASKYKYLYGRVSMKIKLVAGDSAGTVTAFYMNSDTGAVRDELDFEFLGNRTGQPYTVQTNIYANGKGDREQRINLWFDPSADYHTYSILWNHFHVVFYVDEVPIRVHKNNEAKGIPYPKAQPMGIFSTLWEADNWATRGGLEKINWSKAPFFAYYKDFDLDGCPALEAPAPAPAPPTTTCASNPKNWWEGPMYQGLNVTEAKWYRWVKMNHMIYDYCNDKPRYPVPPAECAVGI